MTAHVGEADPTESLRASRWDVVVVGAGPAGSTVGLRLARGGARVLIVDRKTFPRDKVCGCCLSPEALDELRRLGLGSLVRRAGGVELRTVSIHGWGRCLRLPLTDGMAVSRASLDDALLEAARAEGAQLAAPLQAKLGAIESEWRAVELRDAAGGRVTVRARLVVAADGLGGRLLGGRTVEPVRGGPSYIGARATLGKAAAAAPQAVRFAIASAGYLGVVELGDGTWNVAAALRPAAVRRQGGLAAVVEAIVERAGIELPGVGEAAWKGTPPLRFSAARLSTERALAVGDAASFWEPFTGQGIAWALAGSRELAALGARLVDRWDPALVAAWERETLRGVATRERHSRRVGAVLQRPALARAALWALRRRPGLIDTLLPQQRLVSLATAG